MDLFEELESIALNAADDCDVESEQFEAEIQRWQTLFTYSYSEAVEQIKSQKSDYSRCRVSNDHWDLVRSQKEPQGYSRTPTSIESRRGASRHSPPTAHQNTLILLKRTLRT